MTLHRLAWLALIGTEQVRSVCVCGWRSVVVADQRTARQAFDEHVADIEAVTW